VGRRRPRVVVEAGEFYGFGLPGFEVVEDGTMVGGSRGMAAGGGRPDDVGGLWAARPGGNGVIGGVVEDNRWVVPTAGANGGSGYEGQGGTTRAGGGRNGTAARSPPAVGGGGGRRQRCW
jgi:hypothetical protein